MQKINYPLIVSDFDGTLVNGDGSITKENKEAIARYVAAGGVFVISTGRLPAGILPRVEELGLPGVVCCCQGAIIVNAQDRTLISEGRISLESTLAVCKKMEELNLHIHAYDLWEFYANKVNEPLRLYEGLTKTKAIPVTDRPLSEFIEEKGLRAYKLLAMVEPKDSDKIMELLAAENIAGCAVTKSADFLVEVVNAKYSKGTAVAFLAEKFGVPLERTIAVGDQRNDIPMIEGAGLGIAVRNADSALKERANYVCEYTNEESAIAKIIQRFGFYEEK